MHTPEVVPGSWEDRDITRFESQPFPSLEEALSAVRAEYDAGDLTPYLIEIGILASREVTYKIRVKEMEETVSGLITV